MRNFYLISNKPLKSFSPIIHRELANYNYETKKIEESELEDFFKKREFDGLNVTIPYKTEVMKYLDYISPEAKEIGAVNTVLNKDGKLYGYNTDYFGFCHTLKRADENLSGKKVVIIGSGGASKPIKLACENMGAESVRILTHSENKQGSVEKFYDCDVLVNASPVGMFPNVMESPVDIEKFYNVECVIDIIYNPAKTRLLLDAERLGIKAVNGVAMLVGQAKRGCEIFDDKTIDDSKIEETIKLIERKTVNVMLIGMPGSGKTTIGKIIAKKLGREFTDTDELISNCGVSPAEIIKTQGEEAFRCEETKVLFECSKQSGLVISTGGGIVTVPQNLDLCRQNSFVVFLKRDLDKLETEGRPLSQGEDALKMLYKKRLPLYESFCDIAVENGSSPEKTADEIINLFSNR